MRLSGSITALATPFGAGGEIDLDAWHRLLQAQLDGGTQALVVAGSTGEAAALHDVEYDAILRTAVEAVAGRVPVLAGTGLSNTAKTIEQTRRAAALGADAALVVTPPYVRPTQEGLLAHYRAVADDGALPIVLYNVPGRTVTDIEPATMVRIVKAFPDVFIGVKDATGSLGRVTEQRLGCGPDFVQLSGNDETALAFNAMGGVGCISVTANVAPRLCAEFQAAWAAGDHAAALALHDRLYPLHVAMFTDASPGPVKYAVNKVRPDFLPGLRLPMTAPSEASRRAVDAALAHAGLV